MKTGLLAIALCLPLSCRRAPPATSDAGLPASANDAGKDHVTVDRQLVTAGRIKLAPVTSRPLSGELRVAGEVRSSEAGSAEAGTLVAGRIASLEVSEGTQVKRGQVLAWVDAPEVARAAADLLLARSRAIVAKRKRGRQETLDTASATSKNALDDARAEDEAARAELLAARTRLASLGGAEPPTDPELESLIVRVPVRSPLTGIVAERNAVLGGAVSPEKTLFRIVAESQRSSAILARVPETVPTKPQVGEQATIIRRGNAGSTCSALVEGSLGGIEPQTRTLAVRLAPDKNCTWLIPGSFVDVVFASLRASPTLPASLVVPRTAIVDVRGKPTVFVADSAPGEFSPHVVEPGPGDSTEVSVASGLAAGDQIVVEGALLLKGELLRAELEGT